VTAALIYLRCSTERQATEGTSLDTQVSACRAYAAARGLSVAEGHIFSDPGLSGGRADNRPGLAAALALACAPAAPRGGRRRAGPAPAEPAPGPVLIVYSLSRLARSTRDLLAIADRLAAAGAGLASVTESLDTTTATGRMVYRVLAVLAEFEREILSERTSAGLRQRRAEGKPHGGVAPVGWRREGGVTRTGPSGRTYVEGGVLVPDPAALRARELRRACPNAEVIAGCLASEGYLNQYGQPITARVVRRMLSATPPAAAPARAAKE